MSTNVLPAIGTVSLVRENQKSTKWGVMSTINVATTAMISNCHLISLTKGNHQRLTSAIMSVVRGFGVEPNFWTLININVSPYFYIVVSQNCRLEVICPVDRSRENTSWVVISPAFIRNYVIELDDLFVRHVGLYVGRRCHESYGFCARSRFIAIVPFGNKKQTQCSKYFM